MTYENKYSLDTLFFRIFFCSVVFFMLENVKADSKNPLTVSNLCFISNEWMHCPNSGPMKHKLQPFTKLYQKIMNRFNFSVLNYRSRLQNGFDLSNPTYRRKMHLHPIYQQKFSNVRVDSLPASRTQLGYTDYIVPLHTLPNKQKLPNGRRRYSNHKKSMTSEVLHPIFSSISTRPIHEGRVTFDATEKSTLHQGTTVRSELTNNSVENKSPSVQYNNISISKDSFMASLQQFERNFYQAVFEKLVSISPAARQENGISFVQSGLFLHISLMTLYAEVDAITKSEIEAIIGLDLFNMDLQTVLRNVISLLPLSNNDLKFRWSSRLVVSHRLSINREFQNGTALAMKLQINRLNGTETPETLTTTLNQMVVEDSGGAMHNTFEEEELSQGICAVLLTTLYMRPRWRSAPTVLNGSWPFHTTEGAPLGSTKMIRINDVMGYVDLYEWDAEALQIQYATPHLSLILVIPRGRSLRSLAHRLSTNSLERITDAMHTMRVAASIPLYTLRMTLLLPNKLEAMGLSSLINSRDNLSECSQLKLSHAVQRLMFWSEAGRNAFKDDGIEWDETPELDIVVDRPYLFYVRWKNVTLMNGNFVL